MLDLPTQGEAVIRILVTGGAGYIGSHTVIELLAAGHEVVVVDSLANAHPAVLPRLQRLARAEIPFYQIDVRDVSRMQELLQRHQIEAVIHFAGRKAVGESQQDPLGYWDVNVAGSLALCQAMAAAGVPRLVFSSSCTVYGEASAAPFNEAMPTAPLNPYGETKLAVERMLRDLAASDPDWAISILRYFNPVGAHPSGMIGEAPSGPPANLMPYLSQVAVGQRDRLQIFGADYPTLDGTGVRDFIHVQDLALGHVAALDWIRQSSGASIHNLGTGRGYSVLEVLQAFEQASGRSVPYQIVERRPGDIAAAWADTSKVHSDFGWRAHKSLTDMCADAWNWQRRNPVGYGNAAGE